MNISPVYILCIVLQVLFSAGLIVMILLHAPKGEGLGGIGGTATLFSGKRGAEAGLDKVTWSIGIAFLLMCVLLGFGFVRP